MAFTYFRSDRISTIRNRMPGAILCLLLFTFFAACRKHKTYEGHPAILQVFNSLDNGVVLRTNLSGIHPINYRNALNPGNKEFTHTRNILYVNQFPQLISFYAEPDTMPKDEPVLQINTELETGRIYSLFIYGDKLDAGYTLHQDELPGIQVNDSVTSLRFANFSPGQTISVNLKGEPHGSFIQSLPFKSLSSFASLKADMTAANYEFEVRDQATGALLATYITEGLNAYGPFEGSNKWLFKSNTLVLTGRPAGTGFNEQKVVLMNHR